MSGQTSEAQKQYRTENKERVVKLRRKHCLKQYGLTVAEYDAMLSKQGGVCAICYQPETSGLKQFLSVDHNHRTTKVRGLLCNACNHGLGHFHDNPDRLRRAAVYLESENSNG